ncbi:MAG: hypothetical protein JHC33_11890 [Ignisphaera sp.]|nr:hypothetical protein [Ignisphaera sp.]
MSINTTTNVSIKSADLKGAGSVEYNTITLLQTSPIVLRWAGNSLSFNTVAEFQSYINEVLFPTINTVFNTTGTGTGGSTLPSTYVASSSSIVN